MAQFYCRTRYRERVNIPEGLYSLRASHGGSPFLLDRNRSPGVFIPHLAYFHGLPGTTPFHSVPHVFANSLSFLPFKAYRLFHTSCDGGLCHCRPGRRHEIGKTTVELNNAGSGKRCSGFHFLVHILTIFLHFSTRIVIFRSGGNNQSMWRPSPTRNSRLDHLIE